jgi:hypothetical protein
MEQCETCRFWRENDETTCKEYHHEDQMSWGSCIRALYESESGNRKPEYMLVYWDSEQYSASFETYKNFGCVCHERKV